MSQDESAEIGTIDSTGARRVDPGAKRNLLILGSLVGIAVLVVVGALYFGLSSSDKPVTRAGSDISLGNPAAQTRGQNETVSPRMEEQLRARQVAEAERAAAEGRSYIPPDTARVEPIAPPQAAAPQLGAVNSSAGYASAAVVDRTAFEQDRRKGLERFLERFEEVSGGGADGEVRKRFGASTEAGAQQAGAAQRVQPSATASTETAATKPPARKVVEGFTVMATRLLLPLNIPANGSATVLAEVVAGPHVGALITGTGRVVNDGIEIRLNQAKFGSEMYGVQAIGLDGQTSDQVMQGSVDRKLLQRYVIPIAAAAAQGFFTAKSAVGSVVVGLNTSNSSSVAGVQTPAPSNRQAVAAGLGAGMEVLAADAKAASSVPIVVSIPSGTPMGVLFLNEVLEKGAAQ